MTRAMMREMLAARARAEAQNRAISTQNTSTSNSTRRMQSARRWIKRYRPNDHAKRHRLEDDQPKEEQVVSYRRRKA